MSDEAAPLQAEWVAGTVLMASSTPAFESLDGFAWLVFTAPPRVTTCNAAS